MLSGLRSIRSASLLSESECQAVMEMESGEPFFESESESDRANGEVERIPTGRQENRLFFFVYVWDCQNHRHLLSAATVCCFISVMSILECI